MDKLKSDKINLDINSQNQQDEFLLEKSSKLDVKTTTKKKILYSVIALLVTISIISSIPFIKAKIILYCNNYIITNIDETKSPIKP